MNNRSKPAPWHANECQNGWTADNGAGVPMLVGGKDAIEAAVLAHNAFDVMTRRGWHPERWEHGWVVRLSPTRVHSKNSLGIGFDDPFTALVEADKWYVENTENKA